VEPALEDATPPLIDPAELPRWIFYQNQDVVVLNKPGWVVCHPSKNGPWSSLVGALREYLKTPTLHLVTRLDRETSGVVVVALHTLAARRYQMAMQNRRVEKTYLALLEGELAKETTVDTPIIRDEKSLVAVKRRVAAPGEPGAESAQTEFIPLFCQNGYTLARVIPTTGRTHQIRVHAQSIRHAIVGDKLYGPDSSLYLEFAKQGWTVRHAQMLPIQRQALHAARLRFLDDDLGDFTAPPPADLVDFARERMGINLQTAWNER
jgi:23S rRNA pseudouridine1911/1915/1917 synthase